MIDQIFSPVGGVLACVVGVLTIASVLVSRLSDTEEKTYVELRQRTASWWLIVSLFSAALLTGQTGAVVFFGFVSFLALKEMLTLIPTEVIPCRRSYHRTMFWLYLALIAQYFCIWIGFEVGYTHLVPWLVFPCIVLRLTFAGEVEKFMERAALLYFAVMPTVFALSSLGCLATAKVEESSAGPAGLVLFVVLCTQANDVAQYCWGKSFGRHKISPVVSPNKTWEGFFGGVLTMTVLGSVTAPVLTPLGSSYGALLGAVLAVSGFCGDLFVSAVKRGLNVKDTGAMLPGHGGILDRVDSLTFAAPAGSYLLLMLIK